jgi:alpha-amylase
MKYLSRLCSPFTHKALTIGVLASALAAAPAQAIETDAGGAETFVQLFQWHWVDVANECESYLGPSGFDAVQISPANMHRRIDDGAEPMPWWQAYQPMGYELESRLGTRAEFADMVERCNKSGVKIYADLVLNHFASPPWNPPAFAEPIYVRGSLNGWAADTAMNYIGARKYQVDLNLAVGDYQFKIADANWSVRNFGVPASVDVTLNQPVSGNAGPASNPLNLSITTAGLYRFEMDASNTSAPKFTVWASGQAGSAPVQDLTRWDGTIFKGTYDGFDNTRQNFSYDLGLDASSDDAFPFNGAETDVLNIPGLDAFHQLWGGTPGDPCYATTDLERYTNAAIITNCPLLGMPDVDQQNLAVQTWQTAYINDLIALGVDGFRVDAAKHMNPLDIKAIQDEVNNLALDPAINSAINSHVTQLNHFNRVNPNDPSSAVKPWFFTEVIPDAAGGPSPENYSSDNSATVSTRADCYGANAHTLYCKRDIGHVTEFSYGRHIGAAVKNVGMFGETWTLSELTDFESDFNGVAQNRSVVFLSNHDNQRGHGGGINELLTFYQDANDEDLGYVFMLSNYYGYPAVMSSYQWDVDSDDDGAPDIDATGTLANDWMGPPRDTQGQDILVYDNATLRCGQPLTTDGKSGTGWVCEHRREVVRKMALFRRAVANTARTQWYDDKGAPGGSNGNRIYFSRGAKGFVAINNAPTPWVLDNVTTLLPQGRYCNVFKSELLNNHSTCIAASELLTVNTTGQLSATIPAKSAIVLHIGQKANEAPIAQAGQDITVRKGSAVTLNGSASSDSDGNIVGYNWTGPGINFNGAQVQHTFNTPGVYTLTLKVTDNWNATGTDTLVVTVLDSLYPNMNLRGTHNNWATTAMTLISNHTWQVDATFGATSTERFKFDVSNNWAQNFGDNNADGYAGSGEIDIKITQGAGSYRITFNDTTKAYVVAKLTNGVQSVYAKMHLRGTHNNWAAQAMNLVSDFTWQVEAVFGATSTERFKFDGSTNWTTNFGDNNGDGIAALFEGDIKITQGAGNYRIVFNDNTKAYTVTKLSGGFQSTYGAMNFRGTANNWSTTAMSLVADYTWQIEATFGASSSERFKFDASTNWSLNFGDTNADGIAGQSEADIKITQGTGKYRIVFNDKTKAYTVTKLSGGFQSVYGTMNFRGTANNWGTTAMSLVADYTWQIEATFGASSSERFKFDVSTNWSLNFGDNNADGVAGQSEADIKILSGAGTYRIKFNDQTKGYTVTKL